MASTVKTDKPQKEPSAKTEGLMDMLFNIDALTGGEMPMGFLKQMIFITGLIMVYIYYTMIAESRIHQIEDTKQKLEEIRADYTTQKSEYMKVGKQSYLALSMKRYGLNVSLTPPIKVVSDPIKED